MALTITANLKDLSGTADVGWAIFTLVGYGKDVPRISGALISQTSIKALASGGGAISQVIVANDVITPAGTHYTVTVYDSTGAFVSTAEYSLTGTGTTDLSTLTPL